MSVARVLGGAALASALLAITPVGAAQPSFPTADAALAALQEALGQSDSKGLLALLGPEHEQELLGGDPAARRVEAQQLRATAARGMTLRDGADGSKIVLIGPRAWPFPAPLIKEAAGWRFDTAAGIEEIVDRRIGRNELAVIQIMQAYVDAQREYASIDHDGDEVREYAQKVRSSPGKRDGLNWEAAPGETPSPLGPLLVAAGPIAAEQKAGEPFFGYFFKLLTKQGASAPGGAYNYVINNNMIAGFAMIAWPADYGNSGIMSFQISHQGRLFEKDLGKDTAKIASAVTAYDPDSGWSRVAE